MEPVVQLALRSVTAPREVARHLMGLHARRDVLWLALVLVVVLNALVAMLGNLMVPPAAPMPVVFTSPLIFAALLGAGLILTIWALYWAGRGLGGTARLDDLMILLIWLQALRLVVQAAMLLLVLISPAMSGIVLIAVSVLGLWILLHFVDEAHGLGSLGKSLLVIVLGVVGVIIAMSVLLSVFGLTQLGLQEYV